MKLFYSPGTCALAPHIVAKEAGMVIELVKIDLASKITEAGTNYLDVNPNGYVPALVLDDGAVLTEASVIVQYLADLAPASALMPPHTSFDRYRVQQWLAFIATELHKTFSPFFKPGTPEATREQNRALAARRLAYVDASLANHLYLTGQRFTVADAYLWTILRSATAAQLDLDRFVNVQRFQAASAARPSVRAALTEQGLI